MNEIVNKFLLAGDKRMLEMHLRRPRFTYSAYSLFTKNKERIKKEETGDTKYNYQNEVGKACFQPYMAYGAYEDFPKRTASDKVLVIRHL